MTFALDVSRENAKFWNVPCGTSSAAALGVYDKSRESLRTFDEWFFNFYPYLDSYIPYADMRGKRVLEVGLGYGSVGQKIAEAGADYTGLDIAPGPVGLMLHRLAANGLKGRAFIGSILDAPCPDASVDYIVAIGCYHHTGDMQKAIDESYRLLRPGGRLILMVYNGLSYRQWCRRPWVTLRYAVTGRTSIATKSMIAEYDDRNGVAAPHTDFVSRATLRRYCSKFVAFRARLENISSEPPFRYSRERLLKTMWPKVVGLDIYATATK